MKTIESIIERLRMKHADNGSYYMMMRSVDDFKKAIALAEKTKSANIGAWTVRQQNIGESHCLLDGVLIGLMATDFITDDECKKARDELTALRWPPEKEDADVLQRV